jgi:signal peptidase I
MNKPQPLSLKTLRRGARDLLGEADRLKRRHHKEIPAEIDREIDDAMGPVRVALSEDSPPLERFAADLTRLDELLDTHVGDKRKTVFREYAESILIAVAIALFFRGFFAEPFKIPTGSMIPTLQINDHIFVNKAIYGIRNPFDSMERWIAFAEPQAGDVVVFEFPGEGEDQGKDFIKRIVGVAGDRVRLTANHLVVNDEPVERNMIEEAAPCHDNACECIVWEETLDDHQYTAQHIRHRTAVTETGDTLSGIGARLEVTGRQLALWNRRVLSSAGISGPAGIHTPLPAGLTLDVSRRSCTALARSATWPLQTCSTPGGVCIGSGAIRDALSKDAGSLNVTVPEGHVLTFGDNRDNSHDGRYWGFVPISHIKGRAMFIWLANDTGRIFDAIR